jgi:hypothetical protein
MTAGFIDTLRNIPCWALWRKSGDGIRYSNPNALARVARAADPGTCADFVTTHSALYGRLSDAAYSKFCQARAAAANEQPSAAENLLAEVNFGGLAVALGTDLGNGERLGAIAICGDADRVVDAIVELNSYTEALPNDRGAVVLVRYRDDDGAMAGIIPLITAVPKDKAPGDGITVALENDFYVPTFAGITNTDDPRLIELSEIERLAEMVGMPVTWWGKPAKPAKKPRAKKTAVATVPSDEPELPLDPPDMDTTRLIDPEPIAAAIYSAHQETRRIRANELGKAPPPVWSEVSPDAREYVLQQAEAAIAAMVKQIFPRAVSEEEDTP